MPDPMKADNGRPKGSCWCCGGSDCAEFDWSMDNKVTIVCQDCGIHASIPAQITKKPDGDKLREAGHYNTVLALCGTKEDRKIYRKAHPHSPDLGRR